MRILVLGGFGNFGARIARSLAEDPALEVVASARHPRTSSADSRIEAVVLDTGSSSFSHDLAALRPDIVIHCAGPFQGQGYGVARASLASGAHYVDLSDGREFVVGFAEANDAAAKAAGRFATSGASTLPALSTAVIDELLPRFSTLAEIEIVIAPGQHAPRGTATFEAVLSYAGRPMPWLSGGSWRIAWGWQELKRLPLPFGARWGAACDVPDLELLPKRYPAVRSVEFRAALEVGIQHFAIWGLAGLRRLGIPFRPERLAGPMGKLAPVFDRLGSDVGGMWIRLTGRDTTGGHRQMEWTLVAPANHGPEIPCMAAIILARRLARGEPFAPGASACMGHVRLAEFEPEFSRWGITTAVSESVA